VIGLVRSCDYCSDGSYCGAVKARRYVNGWRCLAHTPAALAGRPEPYLSARACAVSPVDQPANRTTEHGLGRLPELNTESLEKAAIRYARAEIPVLPLKPGSKLPATKHGVHDASTNLQAIRSWWRHQPDCNIGVACGVGFDVLDVDVKAGAPGMESLAKLRRAGLLRGVWGKACTPTGGLHLLLAPSGDGNHSAGKFGIDYRGCGGYIVAAPSATETGIYRWEIVEPDRRGPLFDWQAALRALDAVDLMRRRSQLAAGTDTAEGIIRFVAESVTGERNARLYWAARRCVDRGIDPECLREPALAVGLSDAEISRTLASAAKAGAA
jgi:Bifunctional DNA primase/polymerase, N-terminal